MRESAELVFEPIPENKKFQDLTGKVFSLLTVIGFAGWQPKLNGDRLSKWYCRCECGNISSRLGCLLKSRQATQCEAHRRAAAKARFTTHGAKAGGLVSPEYKAWQNMRNRCYRAKDKHYENYGGRGIIVCDQWRNSFESFFADVGCRPSPKHTLDREDNNGNYEPGNVRWVTRFEQNRNQRSNVMITHQGKTQCVADWAISAGMGKSTLGTRLKLGWPMEKALATPVQIYRTRSS